MKKLFFTLAFVFVVSFGFANVNTIEQPERVNLSEVLNTETSDYTIVSKKVITEDYACFEYHAVYYRGRLVAEFMSVEQGDDCGFTAHYL